MTFSFQIPNTKGANPMTVPYIKPDMDIFFILKILFRTRKDSVLIHLVFY